MADLACSMSSKGDGVRLVRFAAAQVENLCSQVGTKSEELWITIYVVFYYTMGLTAEK